MRNRATRSWWLVLRLAPMGLHYLPATNYAAGEKKKGITNNYGEI